MPNCGELIQGRRYAFSVPEYGGSFGPLRNPTDALEDVALRLTDDYVWRQGNSGRFDRSPRLSVL